MRRFSIWDGVQVVGAVASIIALLVLVKTTPTFGVVLAVVVVAGVFAVIVASVMARRGPPRRVGRDAMIDTGKTLIRGAKAEVIMFSGDMSWAADYEEAIRSVTEQGKVVRVLYPSSKATKVLRNVAILEDAGVTLLPTLTDSGLRAILVDPEDYKDALLYVATRTLRSGAVPVQTGEHGSETNYDYVAKVYSMSQDWLIIQAAKKIYQVLSTRV